MHRHTLRLPPFLPTLCIALLITYTMPLLNDSLKAYLSPLLEKHTAGQAIIYDDLIRSWQAAQAVLKKSDFDPAVSVRVLHKLYVSFWIFHCD